MNNTTTNHNLQLILKYRQYAIYTKTIQQILILKNEGYPLNRNSSLNKGMKKIETLQDKIIEEKIQENLHGNTNTTNHTQTTNKIIEDTLTHQRKSLIRKDIGNADKITRGNIEQYQKILDNRLEKEKRKLDNRIEEEIQKANKKRLNHKETERQIRKTLNENKPRIKHILRDATHTNKCGLSFAGALEQGYTYKVWNNGRSRTRVRPWHRARNIQAVEMDDVFEINGSYPAYMMYPGDLNGGAENVANCRCWLSYTNEKPSNLKEYTSVSVGSTYKPSVNVPFGGLNITSKTKPVTEAIHSVVSTGKKVTTKIKNQVRSISNKIPTSKNKKTQKNNGKLKANNDENNNKDYITQLRLKINSFIPDKFIKINYKGLVISKSIFANYISLRDIKRYYDILPPILKVYLNEINISNKIYLTKTGYTLGFTSFNNTQIINLLKSLERNNYLNTIIHEAAHVLDLNFTQGVFCAISNSQTWKKAYMQDRANNINKGNKFEHFFVSDYAHNGAIGHYKKGEFESIFAEDFAESMMLYLDPKTHNWFVNTFSERTKIIENLLKYGVM